MGSLRNRLLSTNSKRAYAALSNPVQPAHPADRKQRFWAMTGSRGPQDCPACIASVSRAAPGDPRTTRGGPLHPRSAGRLRGAGLWLPACPPAVFWSFAPQGPLIPQLVAVTSRAESKVEAGALALGAMSESTEQKPGAGGAGKGAHGHLLCQARHEAGGQLHTAHPALALAVLAAGLGQGPRLA